MVATYFAFLDGAFRYDCASCGQACCRGKGIAISAQQELVPLLGRVPRIAPLLQPLPGGYVRLPDVSDGCWFLGSDGMCGYEQTHGRAAKFTTCRLFPFNRVFRIGSTQVVDVNSVVCPIEDASGHGVHHAELVSELAAIGNSPLTESQVPLPSGARELRWLALETALRDDSVNFLDEPHFATFATQQVQATARHLGLRGESLNPVAQLQTYLETLYGSTDSPHTATLSRRLTLLSPSLRFNALFRRGSDDYRRLVRAMPAQLLATFVLGVQAAAVWQRPLSLRAITELHQAQTELRSLLARLTEPAMLESPVDAAELPPSLAMTLRKLSERLQKRDAATVPLGEHLVTAAASLPVAERALLPALLLRAGEALRFVPPHP